MKKHNKGKLNRRGSTLCAWTVNAVRKTQHVAKFVTNVILKGNTIPLEQISTVCMRKTERLQLS